MSLCRGAVASPGISECFCYFSERFTNYISSVLGNTKKKIKIKAGTLHVLLNNFHFERLPLTTKTNVQDAQTNTQTLMFTHFISTERILLVLFTYSSAAASLVGVEEQ